MSFQVPLHPSEPADAASACCHAAAPQAAPSPTPAATADPAPDPLPEPAPESAVLALPAGPQATARLRSAASVEAQARLPRLVAAAPGQVENVIPQRLSETGLFTDIANLTPAQLDGTEEKEIVIKRGEKETRYKGMQFLLGHAVPNVYFHISTAYNILRHNGVMLGKRDFLGRMRIKK